MNELLVLVLAGVSLLNIALGLTVLFGAKKTIRSQLFFLSTLSVAAWCIGVAFFYSTQSPAEALQYARFFYVAAAAIGFFIITFTMAYIKNAISWPWIVILATPLVIVSVLSMVPGGVVESVKSVDGSLTVVLNQDVYRFYAVYFLTYLYAALALIAYHYIRRTQIYSQDASGLRYIFLAFVLAGTFGVYFNLVLPFFGDYSLVWAGPIGSLVMVSFIFIAIIRHGLFDVRLAIARTVGYVLSFTFLALMYGIAVVLIPYIFNNPQMAQNGIVNIGLLFILAVTFHPLRRLFDTVTDKVFLKKRYDPQEVLNAVGRTITKSVDPTTLLKSTLGHINESFKLTFIEAVLVSDNEITRHVSIRKPLRNIGEIVNVARTFRKRITLDSDIDSHEARRALERSGIVICARLETGEGLVGYLFLGEKENEARYNLQDIEVLNVIVYELAIAIENTSRFKEIQDFSDTLQRKVDTATAELKETNKKLHALDETKDEFISMASHQLRTPLTTIKGYLSMVLDGDVGEITSGQRKVLEEAFNSSQRMVYLIGDFLNVSRLQTGKFELERRNTNLANVVDQEVRQMQDNAKSRGIRINYDAPEDVSMISVDENKMRQVVMNFIDNAIFYTKAKDTVQVSLMQQGKEVVFKVVDHGIGVPASERHKLFTKFFRATNAKKQRPDGTGIGLFMARKVIAEHGGSIIFETTEGKGSTFGFRLPITSPGAPTQRPAK